MMRTLLLSFALLPIALHAEPRAPLDHTSPAALNERALQKAEQGDAGTAILLLERAALLAPHDARIRRNLDILRAWREGRTVSAETSLADAEPSAMNTADASAELPPVPLWRGR